jgi:hypothetical protein
MDRAFEEKRKLREAGLLPDDDCLGGAAPESTIWKTSFLAPETEHDSPSLRLFGIAGHLGELVTDLKRLPGGDEYVEPLNRYFGNVRGALDEPEAALVGPAVERFCLELSEAAAMHGDLAEKCHDLQEQARRFAARMSGDEVDDIPF